MSILLQRLSKEDIPELMKWFKKTSILSEHDPFKNGSSEVFEWQFFSDIYEPSVYIVATDIEKDKLVGTLAFLFISMISPHGKICQTVKPEDTLINIKSLISNKNRDLLKEIYDKAEQETKKMDIKFLWGFTHEVAVFKRLGFESNFSSLQGIYTLNPFMGYEHLVGLNKSNKLKQKLQIMVLTLLSFGGAIMKKRKVKNIACREIMLSGIDYELLRSFSPKNLYSVYLDKTFLEWRIARNPSELKFSILQFTDHHQNVISYLIFSKKCNSVFFIEQFLFSGSLGKKDKLNIIHSAMVYFKAQNANIVRAMGFDHNQINKEEVGLLKSAGFTFVKKGIPFIFKAKDNNIKPEFVYLSRLNTQGTF